MWHVMCNEHLEYHRTPNTYHTHHTPRYLRWMNIFDSVSTNEKLRLCVTDVAVFNCNIYSLTLHRTGFNLDMMKSVAEVLQHSRVRELSLLNCDIIPMYCCRTDEMEIFTAGLKQAPYLKKLTADLGECLDNELHEFEMVVQAIKHNSVLDMLKWSFPVSLITPEVIASFNVHGICAVDSPKEYIMKYESGDILNIEFI